MLRGASRLQALKQSLLEGTSGARAAAEGFRLERFQGSPASLDSADPLLELGLGAEGATSPTSPTAKTNGSTESAGRAMLQRMPAPGRDYVLCRYAGSGYKSRRCC